MNGSSGTSAPTAGSGRGSAAVRVASPTRHAPTTPAASTSNPATAARRPLIPRPRSARARRADSANDVDQIPEQRVARGDHLRVRLERALRADQVDELLGQLDVRLFQGGRYDLAVAADCRAADDG